MAERERRHSQQNEVNHFAKYIYENSKRNTQSGG